MQELILDYMNNFYGYGNTQGRYWFIGMEEGCGPDWETDVLPRFVSWRERGRNETEHLHDYHFSIGITHHWAHEDNAQIVVQFTWRRLIEAILSATRGPAQPITPIDIATYQSEQLGSLDGESCLLELFPLPSPNTAVFAYAFLANEEYPFFATRGRYTRFIKGHRINHIRTMIEQSGEGHVVLYGSTLAPAWNELVMNAQWEQIGESVRRCHLFGRYIWFVPHPRAWNLPAGFFANLGHLMWQTDQGLL